MHSLLKLLLNATLKAGFHLRFCYFITNEMLDLNTQFFLKFVYVPEVDHPIFARATPRDSWRFLVLCAHNISLLLYHPNMRSLKPGVNSKIKLTFAINFTLRFVEFWRIQCFVAVLTVETRLVPVLVITNKKSIITGQVINDMIPY